MKPKKTTTPRSRDRLDVAIERIRKEAYARGLADGQIQVLNELFKRTDAERLTQW